MITLIAYFVIFSSKKNKSSQDDLCLLFSLFGGFLRCFNSAKTGLCGVPPLGSIPPFAHRSLRNALRAPLQSLPLLKSVHPCTLFNDEFRLCRNIATVWNQRHLLNVSLCTANSLLVNTPDVPVRSECTSVYMLIVEFTYTCKIFRQPAEKNSARVCTTSSASSCV